jgi:hypothetical protein
MKLELGIKANALYSSYNYLVFKIKNRRKVILHEMIYGKFKGVLVKKDSDNLENLRIKISKAYERLKNHRLNFNHKLSIFYLNNYDFIFLDDLKIKNMVRNNILLINIKRESGSESINMISHKARNACKVVKRAYFKDTVEYFGINSPYMEYISSNILLNIVKDRIYMFVKGRPLSKNISNKDEFFKQAFMVDHKELLES